MFRFSVLPLNSMSKLFHNRCTCKLIIKTLRLHTCMQTNNCLCFYVLIRYYLLFSSEIILKQLFPSGSVNIVCGPPLRSCVLFSTKTRNAGKLGTMSKNRLRWITLVRGPIWGIHSLTLMISWGLCNYSNSDHVSNYGNTNILT